MCGRTLPGGGSEGLHLNPARICEANGVRGSLSRRIGSEEDSRLAGLRGIEREDQGVALTRSYAANLVK
jgi:hypothetical protein